MPVLALAWRGGGASTARSGRRWQARRPAAARRGTSLEIKRTRGNGESMSTSGSPRVDLSRQVKKSMIGRGSSTATRAPSGFNGWRPEKLRFPAIWSMRLAKEGSRRKLGRLSSFGCGGFEIRGAELADSIDERELLRRHPWRAEEGEGEPGEAQEGTRQVASSGKRAWSTWRHSTAGKPGSASTTATTQRWRGFGRSHLHYCGRCAQGEVWERRERD